jgi:hypothetical protein
MGFYILNYDKPDSQRLTKYSEDCVNYANEAYTKLVRISYIS